MVAIAMALVLGLAAFATAFAQGMATSRAMEAIGRQPEAASAVQRVLVLALAFMEALTLFALLIAFLLYAKL